MIATFIGVTSNEAGQGLLAILVSVVGYLLHRKSHEIQVLVNGRLDIALARIDQLEAAIRANGHTVPAGTLVLEPPDTT